MDDVQGSDNLSGAELRQARFPQSRRGYDRESVHAFLDRVADWVEAHTGVNADPGVTSELEKVGERTAGILTAAEEAAAKLRTEAKDYADELRASAEDEARKTKLNASQKADEIISEAESKAEGIIDEAIARRRRLNQAVTSLIERREEIAEETQGMAEQLLEAVEAVRLDEPLAQQALDAEPGEADEVAAEDPDATPPDGSPVEGAAPEPDPRIAEQPTELEPPDERETTVHETRQG